MAFTSVQSPSPQKSRKSWLVGDVTLTAVGVACVCVVVLCAMVARSDASDGPRAHVPTYAPGFGEGKHTVGEDVTPGTYVSEGAKFTGSARCSVTTEPVGGGAPQVTAAARGEQIVVTLGRGDGTVIVRGCQDFARSDAGR